MEVIEVRATGLYLEDKVYKCLTSGERSNGW